MSKHYQECESCGNKAGGELYHLGFSDISCMYCDSCPRVLLLTDRSLLQQNGIEWPNLQAGDKGWDYYNRHLLPAYKKLESLFRPCDCGGSFRAWAPPRCPICNDYLSGTAPEPDKPSKWGSKYVFITLESYNDIEHLKAEN